MLKWHKLAHATVERLGIASHILYYEDYATKFDITKKNLFDYLNLNDLGSSVGFEPGKSYSNYFTSKEQDKIFEMIKNLSPITSWRTLKRYAEEQNPPHALG